MSDYLLFQLVFCSSAVTRAASLLYSLPSVLTLCCTPERVVCRLETLLFNRWVGWGYATGLGLLFIWLCDLVLNRASMTRELLSNAASGIGNITPC